MAENTRSNFFNPGLFDDEYIAPSVTRSNFFSPGLFDEEEEEEKGFVLNTLAGAGERGAELVSNLVEFTGNLAESGEKWIAETTGINPYIEFGEDGVSFEWYRDPNETSNMLQPLAEGIEELGDFGYESRFTWENFKGEDGELSWDDWTNPKKLAGFVVEQGVHSIPDMVAAVTTLVPYVASRTQEIAEQREINKGKSYRYVDGVYIEDPDGPIRVDNDGVVTAGDLTEALPTAVFNSVLERIGALSIFKSAPGATLKSRIFKGSTREAGTEFLQEGSEYAGEVIGTPVPFETDVALDRGIAGAVAGGGFGGLLAGGDSLLRGNELAEAVDKGRKESQARGGDGLDQAAAAAGNAASTPLSATERLRQRMGMGSTEPEQLMDVEDLAGTSEANPVPVFGATIETPTGTTQIETDNAEATARAARALAGDTGTVTLTPEETTLDPESLSREQLEELYPAAYQVSPYALGQIDDFRRLGIPNEQTYQAILASRRADRTAPVQTPAPSSRQPLGTDPRLGLRDSILMNERDIRAAEEAGDQDAVTALNEDNVRLRSVEAQLRRANELAQQGNQAAADRIIERVRPILQEEAGRRAAFDFTPPQTDPLLLEDQGIIYGEAPEGAPQLPSRVTRRKTSGEPYPTAKTAQAAMNFLRNNEPEYNWAVIRDGDGFAVEGNLPEGPGAQVINEVTPDAVVERGQQSQRQRLQDLQFEEEVVQPEQAIEQERQEDQVSIGDVIAQFEASVDEEAQKLDELRAQRDEMTARDLKGVNAPIPASTIKDTDDLLLTIVKLGGINIEDAKSNDFDTKRDAPKPYSVGRYALFKRNGKTFDDLRESLQELGWYIPEDPNQPPQLGANDVMEDIRDAIRSTSEGSYVYKADKEGDIAGLDRDIDLQQELIDEFEYLLESYKTQINPEEAGRNDLNIYDAAQFFEGVTEEIYSGPEQIPARRAEATTGDVPAVVAGGDRAAEGDPRGGQRRDQEIAEDRSTESVAEARDNLPPDVTTDTTTEAEPQGSVSASGVPEFELGTYTERDIATLEDRDLESMEAREQIDRERNEFALDAGESTLAAATERLGQTRGGDMFGFDEVQPRSNKDYGFENRRRQINSKLNQTSEADLDLFLEDIGAQKKGTKLEKIERLTEAFEAQYVFENTGPYESVVQIEQAIQDGVIDREDAARFARVLATSQNAMPSSTSAKSNAGDIATLAARMSGSERVPYRTEAEEAAFEESNAPERQRLQEQQEQQEAERQETSEWFDNKENRDRFIDFWEKATPSTRRDVLERVGMNALGDTDKKIARRINAETPSKLPNAVNNLLVPWAAQNFDSYLEEYKNNKDNWDAVEWAQYLDRPQEEIERLIQDREIRDLALLQAEQPSNAPEHRNADTGVNEAQLAELVETLGRYRTAEDTLADPERVTRVLQAPAEKDRVRLKDKVNILTGSQGFLSPEQAEARVQTWRDNARGQFRVPEKRAINDRLVVLSLFDLTGSWSDPWSEAGYEVHTFDIQDNPYVGDITNFGTDFFQQLFNMFDGKEIHAILAACPCTDFASSGSRHFSAKDKDGRTYSSIQLVQATLDVIEYFKPSVWAIENPVGRIEKMNGLPPWSLSFDPYHFGEDYTKKTLLWGRMNADLPIAPTEPTAGSKMHSQFGGSSIETKNARSETPEGFAYAFFNANNAIDHPIMTMQNRYDMVDPDAIREAVEAGMSFSDIDNIVMDPYYISLDYEAAAADLREAVKELREDQEGGGESGPVFSARNHVMRKSVNSSALTDKKLDSIIKRVTGQDRDTNDRVVVAPTYADLPASLREQAKKTGHDVRGIRGVFHNNQLYIVRDNIQSARELEEVLFHEGTHGGLRDLLADRGVVKSLNNLYAAMGGREGFEKAVKDLGLEDDLAPYFEAFSKSAADLSYQIRNARLVEEMIAFTGQKDSKGLKLRLQELLGAIRNWFRERGYLSLAKATASDIAFIAKKARQQYFTSMTAGEGTAYSVKETGPRAQKTDQGLFSNAEQVLLEQGDKIFKPSKKNPEGAVRGDQILSFLKGRGLKRDELEYTELEAFLTDDGAPKRTKEEVIRYLQNTAPELREAVGVGFNEGDEGGTPWSEPEIMDDQAYYEHLIEDYDYEARSNRWDDYRSMQALKTLWENKRLAMEEMILERFPNDKQRLKDYGISKGGTTNRFTRAEEVVQLYAELDAELWDDIEENFEYEWDEAVEQAARTEYLEGDPVTRTDAYIEESDTDIFIEGSPDYGYSIWVNGQQLERASEIWDLDEAKIQADQHLRDYGLAGTTTGTRMFRYFRDLQREKGDILQYREIKQIISDNDMGGGQEYFGNHWDEADVLYAAITTDRSFESVVLEGGINDNTLVIEEVQSDWHSDIRKSGGKTYDPEEIRRIEEEEKPPLQQAYADAQDARNKARSALYDTVVEKVYSSGEGRDSAYWANEFGDNKARIEANINGTMLEAAEFARDVIPYLSLSGIDRIRRLRDQYGVKLATNFTIDRGTRDILEDGTVSGFADKLQTFYAPFNTFNLNALLSGGRGSSSLPTASYWKPEVLRNGDERMRIRLEAENAKKEAKILGPSGDTTVNDEEAFEAIDRDRDLKLAQIGPGPLEIMRQAKEGRSSAYNAAAYMAVEAAHGDQFTDLAIELLDRQQEANKAETRYSRKSAQAQSLRNAPPNSPYRDDRYLDVAARRTLIRAIEEGKGGVAFSKANRVQDRWSDNYDYEAIYNRKLKKIFDRLMGSDGMSVDVQGDVDTTTDVGFWAWPITEELRDQIQYEGLPMFSAADPDGPRIYEKRSTEERMTDVAIRKIQDKFLPLKRLQQAITELRGEPVPEEANVYMAEELFYGKAEEDLRQMELTLVDPLMKAMEDAGVEVKELDDFLMAKHAPERNREIAKINPELPDGGSGMTTAAANEYLAEVAKDPERLATMESLAAQVYEMTKFTQDLMVEGGLLSEAERSSYNEKYQFYVPLKGFAENEKDEKGRPIPTGKGYQTKGKETRRALGRRSKAASPLVQVIADMTSKTIRYRKNEVGQAFLALAEQNPDPMQWQVFSEDNPDMEDRWNAQAQKVVKGPVDMARDDRYFGVKRDGKNFYIKVRDQRVLDALNKVGPQAQGMLVNLAGTVNRWLSFVNTAADPTFMVANFARDIQAAGLNILAEQTKDGGRVEGETIARDATNLKNVGKSIRAIANYHRNKKTGPDDSEFQQYYQEFLDAGAKTGYFDTPELDQLASDLNTKLEQAGSRVSAKGTVKAITNFVADYNTAVENGIRLSTYIASRKAGISKNQAASFAKNLTVNFNRKGEMGQALNSLYLFFNAAVQGGAQWMATMSPFAVDSQGKWGFQRKINLAQKVAGGLVISAAMMANLNRMIGGEDDDGEAHWDKINPAIRERNFIIMKPGTDGDYYKFPLPYGYNFFYNLGDALEAAVNASPRRKEKLLGSVLESFITAFSPIALHAANSLGDRLFLSGLPTITTPFAELVTNTDFFGGKIMRENDGYGAERSNAHNYWESTKEPYVGFAKFMNDVIGGGDEYKSGSVDPLGYMFDTTVMEISTDYNPAALQHLLEYSLGGIYRTGTSAYDAMARTIDNREVDVARVPFASKIFGRSGSDFSDSRAYYDIKQDIENARKAYRDATGGERRQAVETHDGLHLLYRQLQSTEKRLSKLRDQRDRARDNETITPRERDTRIERIRERMDDEIDKFRVRYERHLEQRQSQ